MNTDHDPRVEAYLDAATAGLKDDSELQRDVRAELAAHLQDKQDELGRDGLAEDRRVDESLRAMGDVLETASTISDANQRRMTVRGRVRALLRFALVPVAVVVAIVTWMGMSNDTMSTLLPLVGIFERSADLDVYLVRRLGQPKLTPEQTLILQGDPSREDPALQQRAIWERYPTSEVYFGNYLSSALGSYDGREQQRAVLLAELEEAAVRDPSNARFDLLRAALLAKPACRFEEQTKTEPAVPPRLTILEREPFEQAMSLLLEGLEKPAMRRYAFDMLQERRGILGPQVRYVDWLRQTAMAAAVFLPDLQYLRDLSRISTAYGELLLREGREDEAAVFLGLWEPLARHIAEDGFTLIDVLFAGALIEGEGKASAAIYERAGLLEKAARMRARAEHLYQGLADWRGRREKKGESVDQGERILHQYGGMMPAVLLPALGVWPDKAAYEAGRRMEYTVITEGVLGLLLLAFLVAMIGCCAVALRWRFSGSRAGAIPILLIPEPAQVLRIVGWGVLLPFALFLLVTRFVGWSGHSYAFQFGGHKLIAELVLLVTVMATVPVGLTARAVAARCRALRIPTRRMLGRRLGWGVVVGSAVLVLLWFVPPGLDWAGVMVTVWIAGAFLTYLALIALAAGIVGLAGRSEFGLYYGTLFRSLIPVLAVVSVVLSISAGPLLVRAEKSYLARDTLMVDEDGGFTRTETELTDRLRNDLLRRFGAPDAP